MISGRSRGLTRVRLPSANGTQFFRKLPTSEVGAYPQMGNPGSAGGVAVTPIVPWSDQQRCRCDTQHIEGVKSGFLDQIFSSKKNSNLSGALAETGFRQIKVNFHRQIINVFMSQ